jgi:hypothetical protein
MTTTVDIGSATAFALLANASIACTGNNTITGGNVGVSSAGALSGFPPGTITNGTITSMAVAQTAEDDIAIAYYEIINRRTTSYTLPSDLGGMTLTPGLYYSSGAVAIASGDLTLSGAGNYVFQITAAVAIAASINVVLSNGASADEIFWQVGGAFAIGAGSSFYGTLMCNAAIAVGAGVTIGGRLLSRTGAVSMDSSTMIVPDGVARKAALALKQRTDFIMSTNVSYSIPIVMPDGRTVLQDSIFGTGIPYLVTTAMTQDPLAICVGVAIHWTLFTTAGVPVTSEDLSKTELYPFLVIPAPFNTDWTQLSGPNGFDMILKTQYITYTIKVNPCFTVKFYISQLNNWWKFNFNQPQVWIDINQQFIPHDTIMSSLNTSPSVPTIVNVLLCDILTYASAQL